MVPVCSRICFYERPSWAAIGNSVDGLLHAVEVGTSIVANGEGEGCHDHE